MTRTRPAAVAGRFYPGSPERLRVELEGYFAEARAADRSGAPPPPAVIAPHAGTVYSGPIAARAWQRASALRGRLDRVVLIGPAHYEPVPGVAVSSADAFATPLGPVPVDLAARDLLVSEGLVVVRDSAHAPEHCLEVQLPFLLLALGPVPIVPLLAGWTDAEEVRRIIDRLWDERTLIVISTDLSHYLRYDQARVRDAATARAVIELRPDDIGEGDACGRIPTQGLLLSAAERGLRMEQLDLRNSGDTAGDRSRVVGYGAWAVVPADPGMPQTS